MACYNKVSFENLIKTPIGLEYFDNNLYSIVTNTDNLHVELVKVESPAPTDICKTGTSIMGKALIYEVRVSGYFTYSVAVDALDTSDPKFSIDPVLTNVSKAGWLSDAAILPIASYNSSMFKVPYMVIKYISLKEDKPTDDDIRLVLTKLDTKSTVDEQGVTLILLEGEFEVNVI